MRRPDRFGPRARSCYSSRALPGRSSVAWDSSIDAHLARPESFDGRFHYCRAVYRQNPRGDGGSWLTDYPLADIDLSIRAGRAHEDRGQLRSQPGQPNHLIVRLTDDELFQCPVIIMQEVGRLFFSAEDAARLRMYLLKGGFLWVDDFWGSYAWDVWEGEIRKVFPATDYPIVDLPSSPSALSHDVRSHRAFRRFQESARGSRAEARQSAARTALSCTRARSRMRRDA